MTPEPPKALPKELEQVMQDSGPHGAVLVSFGSQISQLRDDMLETMMNAFGKLNQTVIWRIKCKIYIHLCSSTSILKALVMNSLDFVLIG